MSLIDDKPVLRVLIDSPLPGAWNMAVDEAILEAVGHGNSPPTLRFYQWDEPTISLGYFQKYEETAQQDEVIRKMPIVRRQTGGGAILHDDELTYSLILPLNQPSSPFDSIESIYQLVHDAFIDVLAQLGISAQYRRGPSQENAQRGPFFCFARRHRLDLVVAGVKILGSAQRRTKLAALQHGSLILGRNFPQQPAAALKNEIQTPFDLPIFIEKLSSHIADQLNFQTVPGELTPEEKKQAKDLQKKYTGPEWNCQR